MRDPIDELENFTTPGLTMNPLPATEVRRRGTRLRRRNNALATIGGVAAAAIIATPIALAAGGTDRSDTPVPPPATQSSVTWVTGFPNGFDISTGLPRSTGKDGSMSTVRDTYEQQSVDVCDGEGWTTDGTTELRQATYTDGSEGGLDRTVALYESDTAASQALTSLTDRVQQCATSTVGKHRSADVVSTGPDSLAYADHMSDAGDMFVHRVVRVGNALMVESAYAMGGGDPQVVQQTVNLLEQRSSRVLDAMCVFSPDPC